MSAIPPLQPSTPSNEWGTTTLNEMDERAKQNAASSGVLLNSVPGVAPVVPVPTMATEPAATTLSPATTLAAAPPSTALPPASASTTLPPTDNMTSIPGSAPILPTHTVPATLPPTIPATIPATLPPTIPASTLPPSNVTPVPATHSTISSGTYDATYNPTLSAADRYNESGATAAPVPAQVVETPGLDIPGGFPSSIAEFKSSQAGQQAQAALSTAGTKASEVAGVAAQQGQAALAVAGEKGTQAAHVAATQAQSTLSAAGSKFSQALSGAAQYLPHSLKEQVAPYLPESTSVTAQASEHDTVHATSYPSTELRGAQPGDRVGGVGDLPGSALETGVAMPENLINPPAAAPTITERLGAYVPQTVKDTAAPYLPASAATGTKVSASEHDDIHSTSLPSQEYTGAGSEDVGGVGALPGAVVETGVAQPESLLDRSTGTTTQPVQPTLTQRVAGYVPETVKAYIPAGLAATAVGAGVEASEHDHRHTTSMPSSELTGAGTGTYVGGAGELPGRRNETGVAVLPDERVGEQTPTLAGRIAAARDVAYGTAATAAAAVSHGANYARDSAASGANYARDTAASAATSVSQATTNARETVAPGSTVTATAAAPHETMSMPTTETQGLHEGEHVGGVGALPGSVNETGVAVLPEERNTTTSTSGVGQTTGANTGGSHDASRLAETAAFGAALGAGASERHHASDGDRTAGSGTGVTGDNTTGVSTGNHFTDVGSSAQQHQSTGTGAFNDTGRSNDTGRLAETAALGAALGAVASERHHASDVDRTAGSGTGVTGDNTTGVSTGRSNLNAGLPETAALGAALGASRSDYHHSQDNDRTTGTGTSTSVSTDVGRSNDTHRSTEAAALGTGAAVAAIAADRDRDHSSATERSSVTPAAGGSHPIADRFAGTSVVDHSYDPSAARSSLPPTETTTTTTPAADRHTGTEAAAVAGAAAATAGPTDSTEHTGTKAAPTEHTGAKVAPTEMHGEGGTDHSTYGEDYHPAKLHPTDADYSGVQLVDKPGEGETKNEGDLGASAATAGKTENDNEVAGLKEGGDRKLHGGVPGDIGGGTMPVGDEHEGGTDSLDPKNKSSHDRHSTAETTDSTATDSSSHKPKFMDKVKGEMKILSGKIGNKPEKVEEGNRLKTGHA